MQASRPQGGQGTPSCWPAASSTVSVPATWKLMTWRKSPSWSLMASPVSNTHSNKLMWITLAASQMVCAEARLTQYADLCFNDFDMA